MPTACVQRLSLAEPKLRMIPDIIIYYADANSLCALYGDRPSWLVNILIRLTHHLKPEQLLVAH